MTTEAQRVEPPVAFTAASQPLHVVEPGLTALPDLEALGDRDRVEVLRDSLVREQHLGDARVRFDRHTFGLFAEADREQFLARRLADDDLVIGYLAGDQAYAFPVRILNSHELVNDELAGVPVVINALDNLPGNFDGLGARLDNASLLHEAGVIVLFTSGETHNARKLRQVVGNAVANGFPYQAAISAITSLPAAVFGGAPRLLAPGLNADLVIWSGDPLEVDSAADQVIIDGKLDPMTSRQTQLLQRYLPTEVGLGRAYVRP